MRTMRSVEPDQETLCVDYKSLHCGARVRTSADRVHKSERCPFCEEPNIVPSNDRKMADASSGLPTVIVFPPDDVVASVKELAEIKRRLRWIGVARNGYVVLASLAVILKIAHMIYDKMK